MAAQWKRSGVGPSLPQVLVAILDGIGRVGIGESELAGWIRKDPLIAAELLASARVASGGAPCHTIESAVVAVGTETVRAMVVSLASRHFVSPLTADLVEDLGQIWRAALVAADFAHVVATLTRYRDPEQARICGLLVGLAPMELMAQGRPEYRARVASGVEAEVLLDLQRSEFGTDQVELSVQRAEAWCPDGFAADSMRYLFAPVEQVRDAHHLVKIVNLANRFAFPRESSGDPFVAAESLFGLEAELTREVHQRLVGGVDRLASNIGVFDPNAEPNGLGSNAYRELGLHLDTTARIAQVRLALSGASTAAAMRAAVRTCVQRLLNVEDSLLFLADAQARHLCAWLEGDAEPAFVLGLESGRSVVADALVGGNSQTRTGKAVIDQQLAGLLKSEHLWCLPLIYRESKLGVLVLGAPSDETDGATATRALAQGLAAEVAFALSVRAVARPNPFSDSGKRDFVRWEELLFTVSGPLTVIHNHLDMLRSRIGSDSAVRGRLERIREEALRIEQLLKHEGMPGMQTTVQDVALNDVVQTVVAWLQAHQLAPAGVRVVQNLDPRNPCITAACEAVPALVRQLLSHAAETLQTGSEVVISTRMGVSVNGREHVELAIRENRAVLSGEIPARGPLRASAKEEAGHAGAWLDRVRELTEGIGGMMISASDPSGARLQLLFPGALCEASGSGRRGVT